MVLEADLEELIWKLELDRKLDLKAFPGTIRSFSQMVNVLGKETLWDGGGGMAFEPDPSNIKSFCQFSLGWWSPFWSCQGAQSTVNKLWKVTTACSWLEWDRKGSMRFSLIFSKSQSFQYHRCGFVMSGYQLYYHLLHIFLEIYSL